MSFDNLKAGRSSNLTAMLNAVEQQSQPQGQTKDKKSYQDDRLWKPSVDSLGNGYAKIRFLPACEGAELPWVQYWDHGFSNMDSMGKKRWYIEKSLTSIGQTDPLAERNKVLWDTGDKANQDLVRTRKRRLHYVSNILVQEDPANPENEGKIFMYVYTKTIFDKIMDVMKPQFQDETPIDPFDFWEGASFKLKMFNGDNGFRSYAKSTFETPSALSDDESVLKGVYNSLHPITEYTDPAFYKTYQELSEKLAWVFEEETANSPPLSGESVAEASTPRTAPAPEPQSPSLNVPAEPAVAEEEDTMSYFAQLAAED